MLILRPRKIFLEWPPNEVLEPSEKMTRHKDQEIIDNIDAVIEGKLLKDVPEELRTDEICYFATDVAGKIDELATKPGEDTKYTTFASTVRPFIPDDVLFTGFLMGNVGHVLEENEKDEEKAREKNLQESIIEYNQENPSPYPGKKPKLLPKN